MTIDLALQIAVASIISTGFLEEITNQELTAIQNFRNPILNNKHNYHIVNQLLTTWESSRRVTRSARNIQTETRDISPRATRVPTATNLNYRLLKEEVIDPNPQEESSSNSQNNQQEEVTNPEETNQNQQKEIININLQEKITPDPQ